MVRGAEQEARKPSGGVFRSLLGLDEENEEPKVSCWGRGTPGPNLVPHLQPSTAIFE